MNEHTHHSHPVQGTFPVSHVQEEETIDLRKLFFRLLRNWYWFLLCLMIAGGLAFLYNRYSEPVYEQTTRILINKGNSQTSPFSQGGGVSSNVFSGFGLAMDNWYYVANEMAIIRSRPIIARAVGELDFEVSYYSKGRIMETESYTDAPFTVIWERSQPQLVNVDFMLEIDPEGRIRIEANPEEEVSVYHYAEGRVVEKLAPFTLDKTVITGEKISGPGYSFHILLNEKFVHNELVSYRFVFRSTHEVIDYYQNALIISLEGKESSVVLLTLRDFNRNKGIDFLNKLTETYLAINLERKNEIANRTIDFISGQLDMISDSLLISESRKQSFQSQNQVINMSFQTQQLLTQTKELDNQRIALETRNKYYSYLNEYMRTNQEPDNVIAPSSMGVDDPLLNSLILQLNNLLVEKSSLTSIRSAEHFRLRNINAQIESIKSSLIENTNSMLEQSEIALVDVRRRIGQLESQARQLPATERDFINIERRYNLDSETYTFLLQKLSEAQIAKASNMPDSQVLEEAYRGVPVAPLRQMNYAIALLLGLAFPAGIIFLRDLLNTRVLSTDDVEAVTKMPVLGHVFFNNARDYSNTPVLDKPNSPATEPYRGLRNKINLMTKGNENPIVAVTSTVPSEGKSYTAINVASSFALIKKKTVLLDLDLRNSKLVKFMELNTDMGVVDYIMGKAGVDEIAAPTKHPFLHVIPAGITPPNPGEMLMDKRLGELLNELKQKFEVIIIDTAPVGYVTDLFQITDMLDTTLYVVRHNFTNKHWLKNALDEVKNHKLKGVGLVINAITHKKGMYGGYGYGYGDRKSVV